MVSFRRSLLRLCGPVCERIAFAAGRRRSLVPALDESGRDGLAELEDGGGGVNNWPSALLSWSLLAYHRQSGSRIDLEAVQRHVDRFIDGEGRITEPVERPDQCMIGMVLLELNALEPAERYRLAADRLAEFLVERCARTAHGTLPYLQSQPELALVDSLGMVCPFMARYGQVHGVPQAGMLAIEQMKPFIEHGCDRATGLPYHAYQPGVNIGLGMLGWARGTGWYLLGLVELLAWLPEDHPERGLLTEALRRCVATLAGCQTPNGCWRWAVLLPHAPLDTSGTAMIAWAVHRGAGLGCLDTELAGRMVEGAVTGIKSLTDSGGRVGQALADAYGVGLYPIHFGPAAWAQGATLLLCGQEPDPQAN